MGAHRQGREQTPIQQRLQQFTSGLSQRMPDKATEMGRTADTSWASGYCLIVVVTETDLAASEASTLNDENYVYVRVSPEEMAPVDNVLTETVHHQISRSAGQHDATPVLHSVTVQIMPAPT